MNTIKEEFLTASVLNSNKEKMMAYTLRHQVFAEELRWVSTNDKKLEIDKYDRNCIMLGIFYNNELVACLRIIRSSEKYMLENEFAHLLGDHELQKNVETIEVTRFCLAPHVRNLQVSTKHGVFPFIMVLEKLFYTWCRNNGVDNAYMVVSKIFFRLLNLLGMPCKALAPEVIMPDGVRAIAAKSSWSAFEKENIVKRPDLYNWFRGSISSCEKLAA